MLSHTLRPSSRQLRPPVWRPLAWLPALLLATAACGDANGLPDALFSNVVDTFSIGALVGTPISVPSAFSVAGTSTSIRGAPVRSDQASAFDFAFNIEPSGRFVFLPLAVLGLGLNTSADPGLRTTPLAFADIISASDNGYVYKDTVPFVVGDRFVVRSRLTCGLLSIPQYGKIEVLAVDETARTVTFQVLTNNNCGYKNLTPGVPQE